MINISNEFKKRMGESRNFKSYAQITFANGDEITLDSSQFTASNSSLTDGAGVSTFPIGEAVEKIAQFEVINDEQQYVDMDFLGAKVRLFIDFKTDDEGTTERIEKGTYTVITPETYGETVIITAYDDMYKADKDYTTALTFPQTVGAVLRDICDTCDISLGSTSFLHDDFIIQNKPTGKFREVIGYIAMIACGNARIDRRNRLQIISYDFGGWEDDREYHLLNEFTAPKIEYNDTVITGFKTVIKGETSEKDTEILQGTDTYYITVENPLIAGQEETVLSWLLERIGNVPFRPFSGDAISNPLIEFMDLAKVQDRRGNQYNTFVTDVNFLMPGYTTLKNSTPSMSRSALAYASNSAKVEQRARQLVEIEKNARELAEVRLSEALANGSGLYETEEVQPNGSIIRYLHDKPTLAESKTIIKLTGEGIGVSADGGKNYLWGITFTGRAILDLIYAVGFNCDYLTTGAITVKNDSGNIIFSADIGTQKVTMGGFRVENDQLIAEYDYSFNYTSADMTKIFEFRTGAKVPTAADLKRYDIDGDGKITNSDALVIQKFVDAKLPQKGKVKITIGSGEAFRKKVAVEVFNTSGEKVKETSIGMWGIKGDLSSPSINGDPLADFVVDQGTSGIWTYRKWSSGIAECWGSADFYTKNNLSMAALGNGNGYFYNASENSSWQINFPFEFTVNPVINAIWNGNNFVCLSIYAITANYWLPRFFSPYSDTAQGYVRMHIIGNWK